MLAKQFFSGVRIVCVMLVFAAMVTLTGQVNAGQWKGRIYAPQTTQEDETNCTGPEEGDKCGIEDPPCVERGKRYIETECMVKSTMALGEIDPQYIKVKVDRKSGQSAAIVFSIPAPTFTPSIERKVFEWDCQDQTFDYFNTTPDVKTYTWSSDGNPGSGSGQLYSAAFGVGRHSVSCVVVATPKTGCAEGTFQMTRNAQCVGYQLDVILNGMNEDTEETDFTSVARNKDDDNGSGRMDVDETGFLDDDLNVIARVKVIDPDYTGPTIVSHGAGIKLWEDPRKSKEAASSYYSTDLTFYVEGFGPSGICASTVDASYLSDADKAVCTVIEADLSPFTTVFTDDSGDFETKEGRPDLLKQNEHSILFVNNMDNLPAPNGDGVPDFSNDVSLKFPGGVPYDTKVIRELPLSNDPLDPSWQVQVGSASDKINLFCVRGGVVEQVRGTSNPYPADSSLQVFVEGKAPSSALGDVAVTVNYTRRNATSEDKVVLSVFAVDLRIDSNNDGEITYDDDPIEDSNKRMGALVAFNEDDDNDNDTPDYDDSGSLSGENDLEKVEIKIFPENLPGDYVAELLAAEEKGKDNIKVWLDESKSQAVELPYSKPVGEFPKVVYVEGILWDKNTTKLKLQLKKEDASIAEDQVKLYSGSLGVDLPDEYTAGKNPMVSLSGLPDQEQVEFEIYRNGSIVQTLNATTEDLVAVGTIDASASRQSPGDVYKVIAYVDKRELKIESGECVIIPGEPSSMEFELSKQSLVADGNDSVELTVTIKDVNGNLVIDGTGVHFVVTNEVAGNSEVLMTTTTAGVAKTTVLGPILGNLKISVLATPIEGTLDIPVTPLEATIDAPKKLDVFKNESGTLLLQTNASDGTSVLWSVQSPNKPFEQHWSTVSGGMSTIIINSTGCQTGIAAITASIATKVKDKRINFVTTAPLSMAIANRVFVGDIQPGNNTSGTYYTDPKPSGDLQTVVVPRPVSTSVEVAGDPGVTYTVTLLYPEDNALVNLLDEAGSPLVTVTADKKGKVTFQISSTGGLADLIPTGTLFKEIKFRLESKPVVAVAAEGVGNEAAQAGVNAILEDTVTVIPTDNWDKTAQFVLGFWGQDAEGFTGFVGGMAGSSLVVGDAGASIKNSLRGYGLIRGDVDPVESMASMAGLLTSGLPGLDTVFAFLRSLRAAKAATKYTENIVLIAKDAISDAIKITKGTSSNASNTITPSSIGYLYSGSAPIAASSANISIGKLAEYAISMTKSRSFYEVNVTLTSKSSIKAAMECPAIIGEDLLRDSLDNLIGKSLKVKTYEAGFEFLSKISPDVISKIKNSPDAKNAISALFRSIEKGVDPKQIEKIFENTTMFNATYDQVKFLKDLETVSARTREGLGKCLERLTWKQNDGTAGNLFEFQAAAFFITQKKSRVDFIDQLVYDKNTGKLVTDIDLVLLSDSGKTFVQTKVSRNAFKKDGRIMQPTKEWIRKVKDHDSSANIVYAVPDGVEFPPSLVTYFQKNGVFMEFITMKR